MKNKNIIYTLMTFIGAIISFSMITSCINYDLGSANTGAIPTDSFTISVNQMIVRDPYIYLDKENELYYLHTRTSVGGELGVKFYVSKDLKMWKYRGKSYKPADDFWGTRDFWAPDMVKYKDKYYMFVTFSSKADGSDRGTSIFVADTPGSTFVPIKNAPITPANWMSLDATLYVDKESNPWLVFCRSWRSIYDGEIYIQKLSDDLSSTIGQPIKCFAASEAQWSGTITSDGKTGYVTDAPFIHTNENGSLVMLWSSFNKKGEYVIGQAISQNGNPAGPWVQSEQPLNKDRGGHAMLFNDLNGKLKISYHSPNSGPERITIKDVHITNDGWVEFDNEEDRVNPDDIAPNVQRIVLYPNGPTDGGNGLDPLKTTDGGALIAFNTKAELIIYRPSKSNATGHAIIACPGGSYTDLYYGALDLFAKKSVDKGLAFIILNYRVPNGNPQIPINDITETIKLCSANKEIWNINPEKIGVLGVSAGGHLASTMAVSTASDIKLDFSILIYPVITMQDGGTHNQSRLNFMGGNPSSDMKNKYSNELHVTASTPRTYVAYGLKDAVVNINTNSKRFVEALTEKNVPHVEDIYPDKAHALLEYPESIYQSILTWVLKE